MSATPPLPKALTVCAALCPPLVFLAAYVPAIGLGFISDDFGWIADSRISTARDAIHLFTTNHGFYRPLVALSFGLNHLSWGLNPRLYGAANLALVLLCGCLCAAVFRRLGLPAAASWFGAMIWLLNFHGINMSLLWISGRTALLLIAASLASAATALSGSVIATVFFVALALLSKEEAVLLPLILLGWLWAVGRHHTVRGRRQMIWLALGMVIDLGLYAFLRHEAGALTPATAPSYYRFTFDPSAIARNIAEYADRACTYFAGVSVVAWLLMRPPTGHSFAPRRQIVAAAAIWYAGGYAITTFLPVRSSLYACFPSIAAALVAADACSRLWTLATDHQRVRALTALCLVPILCFPVYLTRNNRWTDLARYTTGVLAQLDPYYSRLSQGEWLVMEDGDRDQRVNIQSSFGSLIGDAVSLHAGHSVGVWIEPRVQEPDAAPPCSDCVGVRLDVSRGRVTELTGRPR